MIAYFTCINTPHFQGSGEQGSVVLIYPDRYIYIWLVVLTFNHLEKYESQWEGFSHILWKINILVSWYLAGTESPTVRRSWRPAATRTLPSATSQRYALRHAGPGRKTSDLSRCRKAMKSHRGFLENPGNMK